MFNITFAESPSFPISFESQGPINIDFGEYVEVHITDYFDGAYQYTPTQSTQTIPIVGKTARSNITINPIPSNYGLITWNGAILTVS